MKMHDWYRIVRLLRLLFRCKFYPSNPVNVSSTPPWCSWGAPALLALLKYCTVHISCSAPCDRGVTWQISQLFILITEQPSTAHLDSPAHPSGGSFPPPPPAWHESFLRSPLWPQSSRATSASGPAGQVNLPALIKIASFVAFSLSLSSRPWRWELPAAALTQKDKPLEKTNVCSTIFWMSLQKKKNKPHLILLLICCDLVLWMKKIKSPRTWVEDQKVYHRY